MTTILRRYWLLVIILVLAINTTTSRALSNYQENQYIKKCDSQWAQAILYQNKLFEDIGPYLFIKNALLFSHFWTEIPNRIYPENDCFNNLSKNLVKEATKAYILFKQAEKQFEEGKLYEMPELPVWMGIKKYDRISTKCESVNLLFLKTRIQCTTFWG